MSLLPAINARLAAALPAAWFPSSLTVEQATATGYDALNNPVLAWAPVAGLSALACRADPAVDGQQRKAGWTTTTTGRVVALKGDYPALQAAWETGTVQLRAVIDNTAYAILKVQRDGSGVLTYLEIEAVRT